MHFLNIIYNRDFENSIIDQKLGSAYSCNMKHLNCFYLGNCTTELLLNLSNVLTASVPLQSLVCERQLTN